ncbi:MAG: putative aminopeptidase YsdC [Fimbriimonadaceae bacterium]|nr:putative aminopeptidase YsdC [Fimbriimonadaceae bacterium]
MNVDLLKRLTEAHGVPGREEAIREIVIEELKDHCDITVDWMGNVIAHQAGPGKKLMLAAHMDEIGFMVKHIDEKGFLRIQPLGGWDPRQMASQRVMVHTQNGPLQGVLMLGTKPKHLLTPEEMSKPPQIDNYFVDLGISGEDAKGKVRLGDSVTMDRTFVQVGDHYTCKAMDDRVAVFVMIEAVKAARSHKVDLYAVATVQEEIGLRGAAASGSGLQPDIAVAIDITLANDIPGIPDPDQITQLGKGAAIKIMDSSLICHPKVVDHFRSLAENHNIPHQMEVLPFGGTDAGAIQRLHGGIPSFTLSIPTRYVHTVNETVHRGDVQACIDLLARYIEEAHNGQYGWA